MSLCACNGLQHMDAAQMDVIRPAGDSNTRDWNLTILLAESLEFQDSATHVGLNSVSRNLPLLELGRNLAEPASLAGRNPRRSGPLYHTAV